MKKLFFIACFILAGALVFGQLDTLNTVGGGLAGGDSRKAAYEKINDAILSLNTANTNLAADTAALDVLAAIVYADTVDLDDLATIVYADTLSMDSIITQLDSVFTMDTVLAALTHTAPTAAELTTALGGVANVAGRSYLVVDTAGTDEYYIVFSTGALFLWDSLNIAQ